MSFGVTWGRVGHPAETAKVDNEPAATAVFDALVAHGWDSVIQWEGARVVRTGPAHPQVQSDRGCTHPEDEPCFGQRRCFRCRKVDCDKTGKCVPASRPQDEAARADALNDWEANLMQVDHGPSEGEGL